MNMISTNRPAAWATVLATVVTLATSTPASAQVLEDASVLDPGSLRLLLDPFRESWTERFSVTGERERWTADFERDLFGSASVPSLTAPELLLRNLTGITDYSVSLGTSVLNAQAQRRGTPLALQLGLTSRLMLSVSLPIIETTTNGVFSFDSTSSTENVGWNPAQPAAGIDGGVDHYIRFFDQLSDANTALQSNIDAGMYGCPGSAQCQTAQSLLQQSTSFEGELDLLLYGNQTVAPSPVMPLVASNAATALDTEVASLQSGFASLGVTNFTETLLYPDRGLTGNDFNAIVTDSIFGIAGDSLTTRTGWHFGDVALEAKYLLINGGRYRASLVGAVRLPTGALDDPDHYFDIAAADRQLDFEVRLHQDFWILKELELIGVLRYVHQRPANLTRRVTEHTIPIVGLRTRTDVRRNLGDVFEAVLAPALYLSPEVSVWLIGMYHKKGSDKVEYVTVADSIPGVSASALSINTSQERWAFGGAIRYTARNRFETGVQALSTFWGDGGQTPAQAVIRVNLRLYFGLW